MDPSLRSGCEKYYKEYLKSLGKENEFKPNDFIAEQFGDNPKLADDLSNLIIRGVKTATCSSLWEYEAESSAIPHVGLITVVLNGNKESCCIIETTEITIRNYNEVDEVFASEEGEGDLSLKYWQAAHKRFFSRILPAIGKEFSEDMPLVCERFKVVWK